MMTIVKPSQTLIEKTTGLMQDGMNAVAFGEYGEGYVRISLVENEQRIRQAARNIKVFLAKGLVKGK